ncbi:MAG: metalloregulator ArsR/SmtB family transcription factor [Alcanivoracaceae bacterium]|jgi:ArsR family transcriptional regulator|nr:metalloregulator ArsR/SmtB family transcription factor [Alcanivoracaceae bacterium]
MPQAILDIDALRDSADAATGFLRTLANPDRLMLLCQLTMKEACVSELEAQTGIAQPTLSQQLAVLRREELVDTRREGKQIYYRIADPRVMSMLAQLQQLFCPVED